MRVQSSITGAVGEVSRTEDGFVMLKFEVDDEAIVMDNEDFIDALLDGTLVQADA